MVGLNVGVVFMVVIPASMAVGLYSTRTKKIRWITVFAFLTFIAFFACMSTTNAGTRAAVWGYPALMGTGLGMTLVALLAAGQLSVPPELIAVASGIMISIRSLGGTIGIAICESSPTKEKPPRFPVSGPWNGREFIYLVANHSQNRAPADNAIFISETNRIPGNVASAGLKKGLPASSVDEFVGYIMAHNQTAVASIPGVTPAIITAGTSAMLDTYAVAFRYVWISAIPFLVVAAIGTYRCLRGIICRA